MTQTTTDYLLPLANPATDRSLGAAGSNGSDRRFDDHLSQASTVAANDGRNRKADLPRSASSRDRDQPAARQTNDDNVIRPASGSAAKDQETNASASVPASATDRNEPAASVRKRQAADDENPDEHDAEETTEASARAASEQLVLDQSHEAAAPARQSEATPSPVTKPQSPIDQSPNAKELKEAPIPATGKLNSDGATALKTDADTALAGPTLEKVPTETNAVAESDDSAPESPQATERKPNGPRGSSKPETGDGQKAGEHQASSVPEGDTEVSPSPKQSPVNVARVSVAVASGESGVTSSSDVSSNDEPRRALRHDAPVEAAVSSAKLGTAHLVNAASHATIASATGPPTDEINEPANKPDGAKAEPAAAVHSRLSRTATAAGRGADSDDGGPRVDPSRFVGRVAKAFQTAQDRGGTLQIRLSPPELGSLRLELTVKDGVMSAALQTESATARSLLLDHLPALRDRLAEHNIRVERFDVDVRRDGTESQADTRGSQQRQYQHQTDQPAPRRQAMPPQSQRQSEQPQPKPIVQSVTDTGLNLIV